MECVRFGYTRALRERFANFDLDLSNIQGKNTRLAEPLVLANTPLKSVYALLIDTPVKIRIGALEIAKPLLLWINDGLMAIFFFLIGLELKRELVEGELSNKRNIILPGVGAIGGMLFPALFYIYFNAGDATAMKGWAIPAATDIAFALGILSLLGLGFNFHMQPGCS